MFLLATAYHSRVKRNMKGTALICRLTLAVTRPFEITGREFRYLLQQTHTRTQSPFPDAEETVALQMNKSFQLLP